MRTEKLAEESADDRRITAKKAPGHRSKKPMIGSIAFTRLNPRWKKTYSAGTMLAGALQLFHGFHQRLGRLERR
jgi:hypothetical protein